MNLVKSDYENLLKFLETVKVDGLSAAKYIAVLGHKIEARIENWYDGHETGFKPQEPADRGVGVEHATIPLNKE